MLWKIHWYNEDRYGIEDSIEIMVYAINEDEAIIKSKPIAGNRLNWKTISATEVKELPYEPATK